MFVNLNESNRKAFENLTIFSSQFSQSKMNEIRKYDWRSFKNDTLRRGFFRAVSLMGDSGLSNRTKLLKWKNTKVEMNRMFSTARINETSHSNSNHLVTLNLEPNITSIFHRSRDYNHLASIWRTWRDNSGKKIKDIYPDFIDLSNEAVREFGYQDYGEFLRSNFEVPNLDLEFDRIYKELQPLYRLLHAYVKQKLKNIYKSELDDTSNTIPAHILGDLWAQQWHNIFEDIKPYQDKPLLDVTEKMRAKVYSSMLKTFFPSIYLFILIFKSKKMTVKQMFKISEEFFTSLGFESLPKSFWNESILERPSDKRDMNCHPSAFDFFNGKDFR